VRRSRPLALLIALVLVGCDRFSSPAVAPSLAPCGAPTPLTMIPGFGLAAKAGPLAMRGWPDGPDATIRNWTPGTLEKVLLIQVESAPSFSVRGSRCEDGRTLRFWYRATGPAPVGSNPTPIPDAVLATMGDELVVFGGGPASPPDRITDLPGYMLFTSEGDWRIDVRSGEKLLGSAVLRVQRGN
jgi:hypothetical protein